MKKHSEQLTPDPEFIRPAVPPEEGKQSENDFALRLAASLRAEKEAREASASPRPSFMEKAAAQTAPASKPAAPEPESALPLEPEPLSDDLEAELAALLDMEPKPEPQPKPEPETTEPEPPASQGPTPRPARRGAGPSVLRGTELQPARLEVRPSAQRARNPLRETASSQDAPTLSPDAPLVRTDLSSKPFIPPEEDPSLEELFEPSPDKSWLQEVLVSFPEEEITPVDLSEPAKAAPSPGEEEAPDDLPAPPEAAASAAEPMSDRPAEPALLSRDTTGSLPSLEELFGSSVPAEPTQEEAPVPEKPEESSSKRPARGGKLRGLLSSLLLSPSSEEEPPAGNAEAEARPPEEAQSPSGEELSPEEAPVQRPSDDRETLPEFDLAELDVLLKSYMEEDIPADAPAGPEPLSEPASAEAPEADAAEAAVAPFDPVVASEPAAEPVPVPPPEEAEAASADETPPETAAPAEARPLPHRKKIRGEAGAATALTVEELLSAAVPIEEAAPPQIPQPQPEEQSKPSARRRRKHKRKQSALRADAGTAAVQATAAAARTPRPPIAEAATAWSAAAFAAEHSAPRPDAAPEKAEDPGAALPPRQPEKPSEPVPSADVRKEAPLVKTPERVSPPPGEPAVKPTEEERSVLHPEEAYRLYATPLDEIGTRLVLTGLFTILSLFFTLYLTQHWSFLPEIFSGGTTVYVQLGLLGLMFLTSRKLLFHKLKKARGLHPALLMVFAAFFTAIDCFSAAKVLRSPFTVVFGALAMVFLWGEYDRGLAYATTVKILRGGALSSGVSEVPEIAKGTRGLVRTPPNEDRFMEKLETRDLTERVSRVFAPTAAVCGLALTLLISLSLKQDFAWTGALIFLGSVPTAGLLVFPRLYLLLSRRLAEADAALCGYHGAEVFGGEHSILIGDEDIFPAGSLTLNGFKLYSGNPDRIIAYAAAAVRSSGSALDPVFDDLLVTHNGRHYTVDTFRFYDSGGIGTSIGEDVVLMGSLDFMRRMGVHMDKGARVKQAVYMSLNGELAAVFAVRYTPPENLHKGLASIAANRHFKGILVTRTFLGTPAFLKAKFGIPAGTFLYPSTSERIRLSEAELKRAGAQGAILAKDSFSGFAQAAAGGRMLRSATLGGAVLTVLGGISGLVLMSALAALKAQETATALNLLLYVGAWLSPSLLLTVWGRHF